jgi:hypothetical protein
MTSAGGLTLKVAFWIEEFGLGLLGGIVNLGFLLNFSVQTLCRIAFGGQLTWGDQAGVSSYQLCALYFPI